MGHAIKQKLLAMMSMRQFCSGDLIERIATAGAIMPTLIDQLIFTVGEIGGLADEAISFKSKCRATRALAIRVFEYLHDFKEYEAENTDILEVPLTQVDTVLKKAKEMLLEASRIGWLKELWKIQQMDKKFHDLEMEFNMAQIGMHNHKHKQNCSRNINLVVILMLAGFLQFNKDSFICFTMNFSDWCSIIFVNLFVTRKSGIDGSTECLKALTKQFLHKLPSGATCTLCTNEN